jgi:tRNA-splicing ligase RtcB
MKAAVNFAFANRQVIADRVRRAFRDVFGKTTALRQVYDVCHNVAKVERHLVRGKERDVVVHRKGATRAFPPGHPLTPAAYRDVGQPVMVPGDMGRYSFVLVGTEGAWRETFGSCCHGAGRLQSRTKAQAATRGRHVMRELEAKGIAVRAASRRTVDEEYPEAYKDVADVVRVVAGAGLARLVARLEPFAVVKG